MGCSHGRSEAQRAQPVESDHGNLNRPGRGGGVILTHACHAMGTRFEFLLVHADKHHALATAEAAAQEVLRLHNLWSPFESSSVIAALNREAHARPMRVDADTFALLNFCKDIHTQSAGTFDITLGHRMRAHGFRGGTVLASCPPSQREGEGGGLSSSTSVPLFGSHHIHLDPATHSVLFTANIALDLGAVAKGWALDAAATILREARITSALLHAGTSSVLAIGQQPDSSPWRVRVSPDPDAPVVDLSNNALSVSAPHGRVLLPPLPEGGGGGWADARAQNPQLTPDLHSCATDLASIPPHLSHTIDPRTGQPTAPLLHAAVIAPNAALADAWSTALLVDGKLPPTVSGVTALTQSRDGLWSLPTNR